MIKINDYKDLNTIGNGEESFATEIVNYVNSFLKDKTIETKMDEIYKRDIDLNKIIKDSNN